jgi:hypothetical protein
MNCTFLSRAAFLSLTWARRWDFWTLHLLGCSKYMEDFTGLGLAAAPPGGHFAVTCLSEPRNLSERTRDPGQA